MKKGFLITFLVIGLMIGILLTWQFISEPPLASNFPTDEMAAKDQLFKDFLDEQSYLQSRIVLLREQIEESQDNIELQSEISNLNFLESLKKDIGLLEVRGKGIEILLNDSPFALREGAAVSDIELIQAADVRDVVNVLNAANAEAISVNNQRIIATSPVTSVGTTILVNNSYTSPPFTINAIGDVEIMLQRLLNDKLLSSLYERTAKHKIIFEIFVKDWITVPVYNGDLKVGHLNLIN